MAMVVQAKINSTFDIEVLTVHHIRKYDGVYFMNKNLYDFLKTFYVINEHYHTRRAVQLGIFEEVNLNQFDSIKQSMDVLLVCSSLELGKFLYVKNSVFAQFLIDNFSTTERTIISWIGSRRARSNGIETKSQSLYEKAEILNIRRESIKTNNTLKQKAMIDNLPVSLKGNAHKESITYESTTHKLIGVVQSVFNSVNFTYGATQIQLKQDMEEEIMEILAERKRLDYRSYSSNIHHCLDYHPISNDMESFLQSKGKTIKGVSKSIYEESFLVAFNYGSLFLNSLRSLDGLSTRNDFGFLAVIVPVNYKEKPIQWILRPKIYAIN